MSSPARGSRTPRRETNTPSRRSTRQTPSRGSQTPSREENGSRTPRRTPAKRSLVQDGVDGTPMKLGPSRQNGHQDGSSEIPATSPAPHIIPTSPGARKTLI